MSPFSEANSVIGRSFTLAGKIMGDLRLNAGAYSSLGSNLQYNNVCIAENEEELPQGWEPLSVELGYKRTDNVVSIGVGWSYISSVGEAQINHPPHMLIPGLHAIPRRHGGYDHDGSDRGRPAQGCARLQDKG